MKSLLIVTLLLLTLSSCEKDHASVGLNAKWNWKSTCGGFTGACGYSSPDNIKTLEITKSRIIEKVNGMTRFDSAFRLKNVSANNTSTIYELELEGGAIWRVTLTSTKTLDIAKGDFRETYERITK